VIGSGPTIFGIPDLDGALAPVLPAGWLGLLEGDAGSGVHLLAKQAARAAAPSLPTTYLTTYESSSDVERVFDEFGWDRHGVSIVDLGHDFHDSPLGRDLAVSRARARGLTLAEATLGGVPMIAPPPPAVTDRILAEIAPLAGPYRFVLDSFDLALEQLPPATALGLVRQLRRQTVTMGGGSILVFHPEVPDRRTRALLEETADFTIELSLVEEGRAFHPRIALSRLRDHPERTRILRGAVGKDGFHAQL
jgi:KaiC/GvpD/RAD55 family RecA-like ATPase